MGPRRSSNSYVRAHRLGCAFGEQVTGEGAHFFADSACSVFGLQSRPSPARGREHALRVFYPPGYEEHTLECYPVLYRQDSQNRRVSAAAIATCLVRAGVLYAAAGVVFAVCLLLRGLARFDTAAARAGWGFKLLVLPGFVALWPLLLPRLLRGAPAEERNVHDRAAAGGGR